MFGKLLIYDLKDCNSCYLSNKEILTYFINTIINIMNMKSVGLPQFEYFESNEFNIKNDLVGYSVTQIISMSSITIHICELSKNVYIDIFTCCKINPEIINNINYEIKKIFNPTKVNHQIIDRD